MKTNIIIVALLSFVGLTASAEVLKQGESLVRSLQLEFDDQAKEDDVFISWELNGDWDKFDFSFSQGTLEDKIFTIRANEYKDFASGHEGIVLTIEGKPKTREDNYTLSMHVIEVSDDLDFPKDSFNADFSIEYLLPPPPPLWKRLLIPCIILFALILITILVFHFAAKFPDSLLQLGHDEIELKGRKSISVRKELEDKGISVGEGMDVILVRKRFVSYQGPVIKEIQGCELHRIDGSLLATGDIIYPEETIYGMKNSNGDDIIIRQC